MADSYRTLNAPVSAEIEVKRSRFLCDLRPVASEEGARAVVDEARKAHWDARHHCSAFVLGPAADVRRSNDDGEPSGTAGMPMLEVLTGADLTDVVAVVTRWFGGTLLGTGGLVRAYGDAVREALGAARVVTYERMALVNLQLDVGDVGRVENAVRASGYVVQGVDYAQTATLRLAVPPRKLDDLDSTLAELTGGRAVATTAGETWAAAK